MLRRVVLALAFVFSSTAAFADSVLVIVDLQMQTMHVRVDGITQHRWAVSSGRTGFETPPGRYQPTRMYKKYFSRQYDNAPMPFSIFFHQGYAIHGTSDLGNLGRIASHGCVRLDPANAELLFELVKRAGPENTVIRVESDRATTAILSEPIPDAGTQIESAEAGEPGIDILTTGSTGVPWLRKGLDS
jgi:hypothetical protein